jgi:carbon-monoxide dehydrogenase iron sulfur subunit
MMSTLATQTKKVLAKADLCVGCELCMAACSVTHFGEVNPRLSGIIIRRDLFQRYEVQFICRHCDEPKCIDACIMGNIKKDPETGVVTHNLEDCVGCLSCLMACPFDSINRAVVKGRPVVVRCDLCPDREIPACVVVCPTEALVMV